MDRCIFCGVSIFLADDGSRWLHNDGWAGRAACKTTVATPPWKEASA